MTNREKSADAVRRCCFAQYEAAMFLDTHPDDTAALDYFKKISCQRNKAVDEYTSQFGPLTMAEATGDMPMWEWINGPWPWEREAE